MAGFRWLQVVSAWFQVVSVDFRWFHLVSGGFRWFQVVPRFNITLCYKNTFKIRFAVLRISSESSKYLSNT